MYTNNNKIEVIIREKVKMLFSVGNRKQLAYDIIAMTFYSFM